MPHVSDPSRPAGNSPHPDQQLHGKSQKTSDIFFPFSISLIAEKNCDQAPISRIGGRGVDCKRPGLRAGCKEVAQRLLFSEDSEDAGLARRGEKNSQFSSAPGFCQDVKAQNKGCSTQWVSFITIYDITSVFFCFSEYALLFKNPLCVSVVKQ